MRPIRTIAVFPTLLTLGNLICGFFAIVVASRIDKPEAIAGIDPLDIRNAMTSGCLIFLAMVFDGLDGYVARLARTTTDFGAQLDSLCDVVSFGVAPAFLLVKMCPRFTYFYDQAIWVIAAAFAACAALRLARFNVETSEDD
ncbi:MAG: CDP-diacylglycerol--serine O-phosphatidyltransferase, partial [Thermoguttaceae bacterium]